MGMIMKDGVPYGGVYPIDDVPTQGSSNTVKSGGVFSSLSNKVDKVAGKGLSTNDYDDTEKGKVADNTAAIEAITDVYGAKNLWNVGEIFVSNGGGTYTFNNGILSVVSSGSQYSGVYRDFVNDISNDVKNIPITIEFDYKADADIDVYVGISNVFIETSATTNFKHFKLSVDSFSSMASTVLVIYDGTTSSHTITVKNFMIRDARITDSTYVPYAMTNRELTDKVMSMMPPISLAANGTVMFVNADNKWGIFLPLPFIVNRSLTFSFSNIQIVYVMSLTYAGNYVVRNNGVIVLVNEDLSGLVNREGYAEVTISV